jgi:hypothetical protein
MVRKHVHAVVLTAMHRLSRPDSALSANDQVELADVLHAIFPARVREYLFDNAGQVRSQFLDVLPLGTLLEKHLAPIAQSVVAAFTQGWPEEDSRVIEPDSLRRYILKCRSNSSK